MISKDDWRARFHQLMKLVGAFSGRIRSNDGLELTDRQQRRLPTVLALLYRRIGNRLKRGEVVALNRFRVPNGMGNHEPPVAFYLQNVGKLQWVALSNDANPLVQRSGEGVARVEEERLVGFLYQVFAYELCMTQPYRSFYYGSYDEIAAILEGWLPAPVWTREGDDLLPARYFQRPKALALVWHGKRDSTLCCGAREPLDLEALHYWTDARGAQRLDLARYLPGVRMAYWEFFRGRERVTSGDFWR